MTTSLVITTELKLAWQFENALDLTTGLDVQNYRHREALTDGTADNQANNMWHDRLCLNSATPEIDLELDSAVPSGTVLGNSFGQAIAFTKVRQVIIVNKGVPNAAHDEWTPTANCDVLVGGFGTNAWQGMFNGSTTSEILLPSGGMLICTAPLDGWAVSATNAILRISLEPGSSLNDVDVDVIIVGVGVGTASLDGSVFTLADGTGLLLGV